MENVFEFAMKMEEDGKAHYEKMASMTDNQTVKNVLLELAQDEEKHYRIFKKFRDGDYTGGEEIKAHGSRALENAKNVFETLPDKEYTFGEDVKKTWKEAQELEKKSEDLYREKAKEEQNEDVKHTLNIIADEEHKHWAIIEQVLQFMDHPKRWIDDAEWRTMMG